MDFEDAEKLILKGFDIRKPNARWADLGCGKGTFTVALANRLGFQSKVYAVDLKGSSMASTANAKIEFIKADFEKEPFPFSNLDGILMANSLHFIRDKSALIGKLIKILNHNGQYIIVEYELKKQNLWVPHPITFNALKELFEEHGYSDAIKIGERKSVYGVKMYACSIKR